MSQFEFIRKKHIYLGMDVSTEEVIEVPWDGSGIEVYRIQFDSDGPIVPKVVSAIQAFIKSTETSKIESSSSSGGPQGMQ